MSAIEVARLTEDDWELWRDLRLRALQESPHAFGSTYARELAFTEQDWRDRAGAGTGVTVIARRDGEPAGMGGGFRDRPGWLKVVAMWTDPDHRGRGAGTAVLAHVASWAEARDLRVHLDVAVANPGARAVYERAGFVATGETRPLRDGSTSLVERLVKR